MTPSIPRSRQTSCRASWASSTSPVGQGTSFESPAWVIEDGSTEAGSTGRYAQTPSPSDHAAGLQNGWVLRTRLRVLEANDAADLSVLVSYSNGADYWVLYFGSEPDGDAIVGIWDGITPPGGPTAVVAGDGDHLYELIYEPATGLAHLYVDGADTPVLSSAGISRTQSEVRFGSGISAAAGSAAYSLVEWAVAEPDVDGDGFLALDDNCVDIANPQQLDADLDGYGNICDADFDNSFSVGAPDFVELSVAWGCVSSEECYDGAVDMTGDGIIGTPDFVQFSLQQPGLPGASGLACADRVPCLGP